MLFDDPRDRLRQDMVAELRRQYECDDVDGGLLFIDHECHHTVHCSVAIDIDSLVRALIAKGWRSE